MKRYLFFLSLGVFIFLLSCEENDLVLPDDIFPNDSEKLFNNGPACVLYIEKQPEFESGLDSLQNYLESYLPGFGKVCLSGKVFLKFIVEKNGKVGNLEIVKGFGQPYDSMILKSLPEIPDFKPAILKDQPVKAQFILPLIYKM